MPNPFDGSPDPERKYIGIGEGRGEDLISLLFRTSIRLQTTFDRRFAPFGITAQEAAVLVRCVEAGETSAGKLAQAMGRDKGKITRFVHRLEAGSLLTRSCNPNDHRLLIIKATGRGRRLAPRLKSIFEEVREQFLEAILSQDIEGLDPCCHNCMTTLNFSTTAKRWGVSKRNTTQERLPASHGGRSGRRGPPHPGQPSHFWASN